MALNETFKASGIRAMSGVTRGKITRLPLSVMNQNSPSAKPKMGSLTLTERIFAVLTTSIMVGGALYTAWQGWT